MISRSVFRVAACLSAVLLVVACVGEKSRTGTSSDITYHYATLAPQSASLPERQSQANSERWSAAVDASVYAGLMQMLGVGSHCLDFSATMTPDIERLAAAHPDMLLVSAYDGVDTKRYERLAIPVVLCRDFLEPSPLARAEWMRYFGRLWCVADKADSLFAVVENGYRQHMVSDSSSSKKPVVLFDTLYGSLWYQPTPQSTIGQMVADAGGALPFCSDQRGGSVAYSAEQVLMEAKDAEVWIIRTTADLMLADLKALNPVYGEFKAFREGRVFAVNTLEVPFYEETPFRPDWLLSDFCQILRRESPAKLRYFRKLE